MSRIEEIRSRLESSGLSISDIYTIQEPAELDVGNRQLRYLEGVRAVNDRVKSRVKACLDRGLLPVVIGGDHSIAIGSVSAAAESLPDNSPLGLLWIDAHIDMNTPLTTPSGNVHGMALAALTGLPIPEVTEGLFSRSPANPIHTAVVGFRFADITELPNVPAAGPAVYSCRDIDQRGLPDILEDVLPRVAGNTGGLHLSLDLDALDPSVAPSVNTPFPGGMTFREVRSFCDHVAATGRLISMDLVEHDPQKGHEDIMVPLMAELIACALGASAMPDTPIFR